MNIKESTSLEEIKKLAHPCNCESCDHGCNFGSGVFTDDQIDDVAKYLNVSRKELEEKYLETTKRFNTKKFKPKLERKKGMPYGKCIFFDKKIGCKIHEVKPLECALAMPCKPYGEKISIWFMHNQFVNKNDEVSMKEYKAYLKSGGKKL